MIKILIVPNAFKEALNSIEVAECIKEGFLKVSKKFKIYTVPFADGGTGTSEILTKFLKGKFVNLKVSGPLPEQKVISKYGIIFPSKKRKFKTAIIELAESSGLKLVPYDKRNPLITTTKGVGELIADAIKKGVKEIILGIGDSATIDCGLGALSVLGFKFLDKYGNLVEPTCRGLINLSKIILPEKIEQLKTLKITIAADVTNPLTGRTGAIMFAKQKGADKTMFPLIDKALRNFKKVIFNQFKIDIDKIPGSGAAGGIGGSMKVLLNAEMKSGFEIVKEITSLENKISDCDIVITGEGKIDAQTLHGKTVKRIIDLSRKFNKPVICIAGNVTEDAKILYRYGVIGIYSNIPSPDITLSQAIKNVHKFIKNISESIARTLLFCKTTF